MTTDRSCNIIRRTAIVIAILCLVCRRLPVQAQYINKTEPCNAHVGSMVNMANMTHAQLMSNLYLACYDTSYRVRSFSMTIIALKENDIIGPFSANSSRFTREQAAALKKMSGKDFKVVIEDIRVTKHGVPRNIEPVCLTFKL